MIEKLDIALFSNNDIVFGNIDSVIVTFFSNNIGLHSINLNDINLDDHSFYEYNPKTINQIRLGIINLNM